MAFPVLAIRVMIASPGDVDRERDIAYQVINDWNAAHSQAKGLVLLPVRWERNATAQYGRPGQAVINEHLTDAADILVGIFWSKLGTPTEDYTSGTVEEITRHSASKKLTLLYFSTANIPREADVVQLQAVRAFEQEARKSGSPFQYSAPEQFRELFSHHLAIEMNRNGFGLEPRALLGESLSSPAPKALSEAAERLLLTGAADANGSIFHLGTVHSAVIQANRFQFTQDGSTRTAAKWAAALSELEAAKFIADATGKGQTYKLTDAGYRFADETLPEDSKLLLLAATASRGLSLMEVSHLQGWFLQADGTRFPEKDGDVRGETRWRGALVALLEHGWLDQKTGALYRVSQKGLALADALKPGA